jgi:hypothetical protein
MNPDYWLNENRPEEIIELLESLQETVETRLTA